MPDEKFNPRKFGDAIKILTGNLITARFHDCTVISVDEESQTCVVSSCDGSQEIDNLTVRYMADISDGDNSVPMINSTVIILKSVIPDPIVFSKTWISKKEIVVGNQSITIVDGQITFNDGSFGGLIQIIKLIEKLNNYETLFNKLQNIFQSWTPVSGDGGAALKTLLISENWNIPNIQETVRDDIENKNIVHGQNWG